MATVLTFLRAQIRQTLAALLQDNSALSVLVMCTQVSRLMRVNAMPNSLMKEVPCH